ncbi:MAG: calcium-binding protein, partial [Alphaproteobacteria bacterium]
WSLLLSGNDKFVGTDGDDAIDLSIDAGNDLYDMGAGNDWVRGGLGNDTINGGDGWDVLSFEWTAYGDVTHMVRGITVNVTAGTVKDPYGFDDSFTSVEEFHGSISRDRFVGGAEGKDFYGLRGADVFVAGTSGDDWICYQFDIRFGGYRGIVANLGVSVSGSNVLGTVRDGFGNIDKTTNINNIGGTQYADSFTGNANANIFDGGEGKDTYQGGAGSDWLSFDLWFAVADQYGISVDLRKTTGQVIDDGFGNKENATSIENIFGSFANDVIIGSKGDNIIRGGGGNDTMTGAGGADNFNWSFVAENGGAERITDFQAGAGKDQDILSFGMSNEGLPTTLTLVIGTVATAPGVATFVFNAATHVLSFDADGAGAAYDMVDIVTLAGVTSLTADNFLLY